MAAAESLEKPGAEAARRAEPALPVEPTGVESLHAQGEPGKTLGLSVRTGNRQLPGEVDGSTAVAAPALISETRGNIDQAPGRPLRANIAETTPLAVITEQGENR